MNRILKCLQMILLGFACLLALQASAETEIETSEYYLKLLPPSVSTSEQVSLRFLNKQWECPPDIRVNSVEVDQARKEVLIITRFLPRDSLCPPPPGLIDLLIGVIPTKGQYRVLVHDQRGLVGELSLLVTESNFTFRPESPAGGSTQSGIGMIRGWACDATTVEIQFDDDPKIPVAYGSSRKDTSGICGDDNNGYGMAINWGLLAKGTHQMKTFINGFERSDVEFEVTGLGAAFATELLRTEEIQNFPVPGESVTVEWSESAQNFIIIEHNN